MQSHIHSESDNMSEMVQNRDVASTDH